MLFRSLNEQLAFNYSCGCQIKGMQTVHHEDEDNGIDSPLNGKEEEEEDSSRPTTTRPRPRPRPKGRSRSWIYHRTDALERITELLHTW